MVDVIKISLFQSHEGYLPLPLPYVIYMTSSLKRWNNFHEEPFVEEILRVKKY